MPLDRMIKVKIKGGDWNEVGNSKKRKAKLLNNFI